MSRYFIAFCVYLFFINLYAVFITVYDKKSAQSRSWRVSEFALLFVAAVGGAPFMFLTMKIVRHKTKRKKFMLGIPIFLLLQIALYVFLFVWGPFSSSANELSGFPL